MTKPSDMKATPGHADSAVKGDITFQTQSERKVLNMSKNKTAGKTDSTNVAVPSAGTMSIPLKRIIVDAKFNARTQGMDEDSIKLFAKTLENEGLLQPVVVEPMENGDYYLKAGFRRVAAAKLLEWDTIDAKVIIAEGETEKEQNLNRLFQNLAENVARKNLTPFDTAMRCKMLKRDYDMGGGDIAKRIGMNTGYVNRLLQVVGEGEKGKNAGATLHPDILRQWELECGWTEQESELRTKVCTTDTLIRWLSFPHAEQLKMFNRAMYKAENPNADMEAYDKGQAAADGGDKADGDKPTAAEVVRATKSELEKALEAAKEAKKAAGKDKEKLSKVNGVIEGLEFALGVKKGLKNSLPTVGFAVKEGKIVEGHGSAN